MLVLTRKMGEQILIAPNIVITVCSVDISGKVRIGIKAPRETQILRAELQPPTESK